MIDRAAAEAAVARVGTALGAHAGGLQLATVTADGTLRVRFTGMCTGCPYRPLTLAATVRPALGRLEGVRAVEAEGSRISAEAEERVARLLAVRQDVDPRTRKETP